MEGCLPGRDESRADGFGFGACAIQGWKKSMNDAFTVYRMGLEKVLVEHGHCKEEEDKVLFVGVYDGHKGSLTSKLCADNLHKDLETRMNRARRMFGIASAQKAGSTSSITHQSLWDSFHAMDKIMENGVMKSTDLSLSNKNWLRMVGSTAIVALVYKERIVVANAGNCRCVLSRDKVAVDLSRDHSPELEMERKRIEACHGCVENGRLYQCNREANLKVSRAIGCLIFKSKGGEKRKMAARRTLFNRRSMLERDEMGFSTTRPGLHFRNRHGNFNCWNDRLRGGDEQSYERHLDKEFMMETDPECEARTRLSLGFDHNPSPGMNQPSAKLDKPDNNEDYKKCPKVICEPEVTEVDIEHGDEFLVVASDGIWSAMSSQEVINFVGERVQCCKGRISDVCSQLIQHCLDKEACSRDNMTVVIIKL